MSMFNKYNIFSTDDLKNHYERNTNGHWFRKDTMAFFKSRLDGQVFHDGKLFYFVSSEKGPIGTRKFTVRSYNPETFEIDSVGEFQYYHSIKQAKVGIMKIEGIVK